MERLLEDLAGRALMDPTWYELLDTVCRDRKIGLPALLRSKTKGQLNALKRSLHDPMLSKAIEDYKMTGIKDRMVTLGLEMLEDLSSASTHLGDLTARTVSEMCHQAERQGRKRNTVRRTLLRAASLLLRFHLGRAERDRIFADVHYAGENDTREVHLTHDEIVRLLEACDQLGYHEVGVIIRMALQTSADRGVLLAGKHTYKTFRGLLVRDLRIYLDNETKLYTGEVFLYDTKNESRPRTVPLTDNLCRELVVLVKGKGPDDPVFNISYPQIDYPWTQVRKTANLERVRFKDLRAQISIYGEEAGIPLTVLSKTMGHGDESMTRRYQQRAAALSSDQAEAIERAMLRRTG